MLHLGGHSQAATNRDMLEPFRESQVGGKTPTNVMKVIGKNGNTSYCESIYFGKRYWQTAILFAFTLKVQRNDEHSPLITLIQW